MNNILSEKEYQRYIIERLVSDNGYIERKAVCFDCSFAMDMEMLFKFLYDTQPETMAQLQKVFKDKLEETLVNYLNGEMTKSRGSLLSVLKHGIELSNYKLDLLYTKPATTYNKELVSKYQKNIFSVMEEVWASDKERVDLVVFLNGLPVASFELKCNFAGQSYADAIYQYRKERSPKTRLFLFKAGTLVNFAMDLNEVYMTTCLNGEGTFFLPFNMGNGEGVNAGKGNPTFEDKYSVSYMWEDILTKETLLDLITKFIFVQTKEETDELTGKKKIKETLIFPRYHQLDVIRRLYGYYVLDPSDIECAVEILYRPPVQAKERQKLNYYFGRAKNRLEQYEALKQLEIVAVMRHFVRFYEFLIQVSCFEDIELHKKYLFVNYLLSYLDIRLPGAGYDLDGKIKASNFVQKKGEEHKNEVLHPDPIVKLPTADSISLPEDKQERLSVIIAEINSKTGRSYDNDVAIKAMLQIRDLLLKSEHLRISAKNNSEKEFEFSYFSDIDDALIEGLSQNQDFFSLLLNNEEIKREVLGIFTSEIYKSLRES